MARMSLGDLINTALSEADSSLKLASAREEAPGDPGDFLATELALPRTKVAMEDGTFPDKAERKAKKHDEKEEKDEEKGEKKSSRSDILNSASYGMKLAQALEVGAHLVTKLSAGASPLTAPGPEVMESGFIGAQTVTPKATANVSGAITGPTTTAGSLPTTLSDHTGKLDGTQPENNTGKTAGFTRDKVASTRMARAMQKQAEVLHRLGQTKAAQQILSQLEKQSMNQMDKDIYKSVGSGTGGILGLAQAIGNKGKKKTAQDPSSPQPAGMPAHSDSFRISTEVGESSHIPDNAGLIAMTKAQAKDQSVRAATQHISETPKKDNAVAAHTLRTDGQKVSALVVKMSKKEEEERQSHRMARRLSESGRAGAIGGGLTGALLGAAQTGRAGGAAAGALGGAAGGYVGAKVNKHILHPVGDWLTNTRVVKGIHDTLLGDSDGNEEKRKKSSADPEFARAYLERSLKVASDPHSNPAERVKAAGVVRALKAHIQAQS